MNKIGIIAVILSLILLTTIASVKKPALDKPVNINYGQLVAQIQEVETKEPAVNIDAPQVQQAAPKITPTPTKTVTPTIKTVPTVKPTPVKQQPKKAEIPKTVKKQEEPIKQKVVEEKPVTKAEPQPEPVKEEPTVTAPPVEEPKQKVLTEEEEIIAWNKWRSDIQNRIMRDFSVPTTIGTSFVFSFSADKWGNVSNISVGCETSNCPREATSHIRDLIRSLHSKGMLKFPEGTQRLMTVVKGGFIIVDTDYVFSSPDDYSDYEKIKRQVEK